jgi:hypothetical protein
VDNATGDMSDGSKSGSRLRSIRFGSSGVGDRTSVGTCTAASLEAVVVGVVTAGEADDEESTACNDGSMMVEDGVMAFGGGECVRGCDDDLGSRKIAFKRQ